MRTSDLKGINFWPLDDVLLPADLRSAAGGHEQAKFLGEEAYEFKMAVLWSAGTVGGMLRQGAPKTRGAPIQRLP